MKEECDHIIALYQGYSQELVHYSKWFEWKWEAIPMKWFVKFKYCPICSTNLSSFWEKENENK